MAHSPGQLYRECLEALTALVSPLDAQDLRTPVPATPRWTVRTVVAHLAGGSRDVLSGRMDGAPGPDWTARHVAERAATPLSHLVGELRSQADRIADLVDEAAVPVVSWDISVHLADLHEALDRGVPDDDLWQPVLDQAAPGALADVPMLARAGTRTWGSEGPEIEVEPYELFRAVFSRRSRAQIREWAAVLDDAVDRIGVFGSRDDDQPRPAAAVEVLTPPLPAAPLPATDRGPALR